MGRTLVLSKYLVKNYVLNPLLFPMRRHKIIVAAAIVGLVFLIALLASFSPHTSESEEGPTLRDVLHSIGLNRLRAERLIDLASSLFLYYLLFKSSRVLIVMEEAEIEVLLTQPIEMREYFAAKLVVDIVNMSWLLFTFIGIAPLVKELTGSSLRTLLAIVSIETIFLYMEGMTRTIWNLKMRGKGWDRWINTGISFLLVIGAFHSAMTWEVSPLLVLPMWIPVKSLICSVALSCEFPLPLLYSSASLILTASFLLLAYATSNVLSPEAVSTFKTKSPVVKGIEFTSRDEVPLEHLVLPSLRSKSNVATLMLIPLATLMGGILSRTFGALGDPGFLGSLIGVFLSLIAPYVLMWVGDDLVGLWIYRVYSIDMKPLGRALIMKYTYKMAIPLAIISAFISGATGSLIPVGLLCAFLSAIVFTAFLMMLPIIYFLPRRKVIRWNPFGYYSLDSVVAALVFIPSAMIAMSYFFLALYITSIGWELLAIVSVASLTISILLIRLLGDQLGDLLYSVDVAG